MNLGGYSIHTVEGSRLRLDGGAMFGIVPKALWNRNTEADDANRITLATRCLLLQGHERTILVDTGVGKKGDAKFEKIYAVDHDHATLEGSLDALGISTEEVTDVVFTHLHFDHCGGGVRRDEDGNLGLTFPRARHWIQRSHWDWAHESPREQGSFLKENLKPLDDSGTLELLSPGESPFPNLFLEVVNGHTKGQQLVRVKGEEGTLFYAADLLPTAAHVPLLWVMAYDVEPLETLKEKQRHLTRATEEEWLVVFEHDPEVACATIERTEKGFKAVDRRTELPELIKPVSGA